MTAAELAKRREADPSAPSLEHGLGDPIGRSGLELQYESHLHGVRGQRRLVKNRRGEIVNEEVVLAPQHGRDLVLTVHAEVQRRAEQLLDEALVSNVTLPTHVDDETTHGSLGATDLPSGEVV